MKTFVHRARATVPTIPSALQVGLAAGIAWWLALLILESEQPLYAPIAAVVAIGAGDNRMLNRPIRLLAGMAVAVVVAGILVSWIGTGVWQIATITTATTLAARLIFEDPLARSYAAFHGAVVGALGSNGVIPEQLLEAALGAGTALVVVSLVFPPELQWAVFERPRRAAAAARRALQATDQALRTRDPSYMERAREASHDVQYLVADDGRKAFARQLALLSPLRWKYRDEAEDMIDTEQAFTSALHELSELVRSVERLISRDDLKRPELAAAIQQLDLALAVVTDGKGLEYDYQDLLPVEPRVDEADKGSTTATAVVDQIHRVSEGLGRVADLDIPGS